ncbi:GntR family transcriptional regulator [Streptomyces sp. NPDC056528]|uniref:GntR family transcriptional regulator n=1 Tax=Streptomyces sp. NPDC056528 TaxID=3345854 RepID=UPI00369FDCCB
MASRHRVISDDLRTQISTGRIKAGECLPSEAELASRYTVSVPTLRSALAVLQGEGLVDKIHGRGNFVRHPLHRVTYVGGAGTPDAQAATNAALRVNVRTTHLRARGHLTALMRVSAGSPLTEYVCLSHEGKSPHSLAHIYVPRGLAPTELREAGESSWAGGVEARLAELRPSLAEIREQVSARLPTPEEATALRISSALAVLAIERVIVDVTGRVVEAALLVLPGDRADAVFTTRTMTEEKGTEG